MFRRFAPGENILEHICRVENLVRQRFQVGNSELILVSEDPGVKPGYPPLETNVIFWKEDKRYRLKIFAPISDVKDQDLPIGWLLPSMEDTGEDGCC